MSRQHQGCQLLSNALSMSSQNPLEQLCRLDGSSSEFHDQVSNILYGGEYRQWVLNLQSDDLVGLVDYLDKVSFVVSRFFISRSAA